MTFISRSQWGAQPARSRTPFPSGQPTSSTVHWVGASGIRERERYDDTVRSIQQHAFGKGLSDIDYNWLVAPNGDIYEGRGAGIQSGAHHVGNSTSQAICYIEAAPLTDAAKRAIEWLNATHARNGRILPHNYWNSYNARFATGCPGPEITAWCYGPHGVGADPVPEVPDMDAADKQVAQATLDTVARLEEKFADVEADVTKIKRSLFDSEGVGIVGKIWRKVTGA